MQVNSSTAYTPQSPPDLSVNNQVQVNKQGDQLLVREKQQQAEQQSASQKQSRFDTDQQALEQAIAVVEQEQQLTQPIELNQQTNSEQDSSQSAQYDQPSQRNQTAVSAYQSVDFIAQKDAVSQSFGVDLYA